MIDPRKDLHEILRAALDAVDPAGAVRRCLRVKSDRIFLEQDGGEREFAPGPGGRIFAVGCGKASAPMAAAVEEMLGDRISGGCIVVKYGHGTPLERVELVEAAHPVPDEAGMRGAARLREILESAGENDLVISLVSGGGSALAPLPAGGISLEDKRAATDLLLACGASIHEINTVRKHLSMVKGGGLARAAFPATVINLMVSDVVGDDMDVIASGPFVPDRSTFAGAASVLEKYSLADRVPAPVRERFAGGARGEIGETPKPGDPAFDRVFNRIVASNYTALAAARDAADRLGYRAVILSSMITGDTGEAAAMHAAVAREIAASGNPVAPPACVLSGGETTVVVRGGGLGGRNMEFALHAARALDGVRGAFAAGVGSDGTDGPTDAAGAIADWRTAARARERGLDIEDYASRNDSYRFFEALGDLVKTGPTRTNVMDIRMVFVTGEGECDPRP